jgi:hypothetical protein
LTIARWFWRPIRDYAAIDPVFSGGLFSANNRNGTRNPISVKIMLGASITSQVRAAARRFIGAKEGNIAERPEHLERLRDRPGSE